MTQHSLIDRLQMRCGRVQIPQNIVAIVHCRQILGRMPIDVQRKQVHAEFDKEINALDVSFGGSQMKRTATVLIAFVRFATASEKCLFIVHGFGAVVISFRTLVQPEA